MEKRVIEEFKKLKSIGLSDEEAIKYINILVLLNVYDYEEYTISTITVNYLAPILDKLSFFKIEEEKNSKRKDKIVYLNAKDKNGNVINKRVSNIMLGYNTSSEGKVIVTFSDGTYISINELEKSVCKEFLAETKRIINYIATKETLVLEDNNKILNQDVRNWKILNGDFSKNIGLLILGNKDINLSNGNYISKEKILGYKK